MSETDPTGAAPARPPVVGESDVTFPRLTEAQMATMEAAGRREQVSAGQILFSPGDLDFDLIVVASGCVEIIDAYGTPGERVIVSYGPRQFAGELNLITLEPTLLTARVAAAGEAIFVSREALRAVISHDTRLGDLIMNALVSRRAIVIEAESGARLIGHGGDPGDARAARVPHPQPGVAPLHRPRRLRPDGADARRSAARRGRPAAADRRRQDPARADYL